MSGAQPVISHIFQALKAVPEHQMQLTKATIAVQTVLLKEYHHTESIGQLTLAVCRNPRLAPCNLHFQQFPSSGNS
jgi:hypothetical protein